MRIRQSAGKDVAYLLGVYLGDGCVTHAGRKRDTPIFKLNTIDQDFAEAVKQSLSNLTDAVVSISKHDVKKSSKPNYCLQSQCKELCRRLVVDTAGKDYIPEYVFTWNKEDKLQFIIGLMDSEGFVAANSNSTNRRYYMGYKSCDPWVGGFIAILQSVGIRVGKISEEKPRKPTYKVPTRFAIKMQSWIDSGARFNIARKQGRVDEWASAGAYEQRSMYPRRSTSETNMLDTVR